MHAITPSCSACAPRRSDETEEGRGGLRGALCLLGRTWTDSQRRMGAFGFGKGQILARTLVDTACSVLAKGWGLACCRITRIG